MEAEVESQIEAYIDGERREIPLATRDGIGRTIDYAAGRNRYIGLPDFGGYPFFQRYERIGLDCANGSAFAIAKSVFDALGAKTYVINNESGRDEYQYGLAVPPIWKDCMSSRQGETGLDVGFAFDGDADRCLAVDENGNLIDGGLILYICGKYLMEQGRLNGNTIVTTIMSNLGLYKACDKIGMNYEKTKVGDKYVFENMMNNGYVLGGEQSGHIIFSKYAKTGDGILTSLMLMEVILEKKMSLGKLAEEVRIYPQLLQNVRVADKKNSERIPRS